MGFPTIYYCVLLPTPLVVVLQILDLMLVSFSAALGLVGVRCPLPALPAPPDEVGPVDYAYDRFYPVLSASSIKRRIPVVRFAALGRSYVTPGEAADPACCCFCPICLSGLEARHLVRLLDNCRHVFHKGCLDRWVDQGQSTCPLCRSGLLQAEGKKRRGRQAGKQQHKLLRQRFPILLIRSPNQRQGP